MGAHSMALTAGGSLARMLLRDNLCRRSLLSTGGVSWIDLREAIGLGLILGAFHGAAQAVPVVPNFTRKVADD